MNETIERYRILIDWMNALFYAWGFYAISILAMYYFFPLDSTRYIAGIIGWTSTMVVCGFLMVACGFKLLISYPGSMIWKLLARDHRWLQHLYMVVFALLMVACLVFMANDFCGFLPWLPPNTSIIHLASTAVVGAFIMGFFSILYALYYGRFSKFVRPNATPATD